MSSRTPAGTWLTTLPVSPRSAGLPRSAASVRQGGLARRWNRHLWPIVELLGAAVLIIGLVSVMMGGNDGGLPALLPSLSQTTREATPAPGVAGDVVMAQGNPGRTGEMPGPGVLSDPSLRWRPDLGYPSTSMSPQVVSAGGIAYTVVTNVGASSAASQSRVTGLRATNVSDGSTRWEIAIDARTISAPVVSQGLLIVAVSTGGQPLRINGAALPGEGDASGEGFVIAFDALSSAGRWVASTDRIGLQDLTISGNRLFVADEAGTVHALDVQTGAPIWTTFIPPSGGLSVRDGPSLSPITVAGGVAIVASALGSLYAYDADHGDLKWTQQISDGTAIYPGQVGNWPVVAGDSVLVTSANRSNGRLSRLTAFRLADGEQQWQRDIDTTIPSGLAVVDETIYLAGQAGGRGLLLALDMASGDTRWAVAVQRALTTPPVVVDGTVYVGGQDWQLFAFDTDSGRLRWSVEARGAITSSAFVEGGTILFTASDGSLYAIGGSQTPAALLNTQDPVDVSGMPPCQVPPRARNTTGDATPATVPTSVPPLVPVDTERPFDPPAIRLIDIPMAGPASPEAISGIESTMTMFAACSRPGDNLKRDGLFSRSYFDRTGLSTSASSSSDVDGRPAVVDSNTTWMVPDGRTALVVLNPAPGEGYGTLYLFTENDGRWLIDEQVLITPSGQSGIG